MVWGLAWSDGAAGRSGRVSHLERSLPGGSPTWRGPSLEARSLGPLPHLVQQQALVTWSPTSPSREAVSPTSLCT